MKIEVDVPKKDEAAVRWLIEELKARNSNLSQWLLNHVHGAHEELPVVDRRLLVEAIINPTVAYLRSCGVSQSGAEDIVTDNVTTFANAIISELEEWSEARIISSPDPELED